MNSIRYKILLAGLSGAILLNSCDDFLDKKPLSNGIAVDDDSDSLVYKSAAEAEAGLSGVYSGMKGDYSEYFVLDYFVNGDAQADDAYAGGDNQANFQIDKYTVNATNGNVSRDWGYLYTMVGRANRIINNVPLVPDASLTQERRTQIIAEASFLRAFAYFQLVRLFGDVPLLTQEVTSISAANLEEIYPLLFPERATTEEVYQQILTDLQTARLNVPSTATDKGYVTLGAVNAMLAKYYATVEPHDWTKVKEYCDAVIAGGYSLLPEYDQLWDNLHENSSESIFELNCTDWSTGGNWGSSMFYGEDWKKFNTPSYDLVKAFEDEGDDIRLNASIVFENVAGKWTDEYWTLDNYPFIHKYRDQSGAQNMIYLRLADILLLKAEALNELGEVSGAAGLVDQVRARVDLDPTPADTQDEMKLAIEKERRLELAFEGHRWFDLKRTGRVLTVINSQKDANGNSLGYNLTENRLIWPIPQGERDKNTKLSQNDGY